jgi:hypothetical protein
MSQLSTIIVSIGPPRPISTPTTIVSNTLPTCTTTTAGDFTGCIYTPICSSQWLVSASGTLDQGGFPILVCTPTTSVSISTSTSESITPTGIASASLPHSPLTTGPTTSTGTGTGTTTSTGTTAPVSKSHAARNIGPPSGIPGFILLAWIGVYIFHSGRH